MSKQPCFVCEGDGQVYPFAGKKGIGKECPACKGFKLIDGWLSRCPKCEMERTIPSQIKRVFQKTVLYVVLMNTLMELLSSAQNAMETVSFIPSQERRVSESHVMDVKKKDTLLLPIQSINLECNSLE